MKKIIIILICFGTIGFFTSFSNNTRQKENSNKVTIYNLHNTLQFNSKKDSLQYYKNQKLKQKLKELKNQQNALDFLVFMETKNN